MKTSPSFKFFSDSARGEAKQQQNTPAVAAASGTGE
jgi:hypothetical protein